jgi:uncharacterized protein
MRTLGQIYADVPTVNCRGKCQECCGPIIPGDAEVARIIARHGSAPNFLPNLRCDKLLWGRCTIYADRPLICRLWGAVKKMRCPFGCTPKRFLSDREAHALMDEAANLP